MSVVKTWTCGFCKSSAGSGRWCRELPLEFSGVRRKFSWGGFHSMAYGGHLHLVCALC